MNPNQIQQFNYFATLPDELLLNVCQEMDFNTLEQFRDGYDRAKYVCDEVYKARQKEEVFRRRELEAAELRRQESAQRLTQSGLAMQDLCQYLDDQTLMNLAVSNQRVMNACASTLRSRGLIPQ